MSKRECAACGKPNASIGMGGALLCAPCAEDLRCEAEALRAQGKQVNIAGLARAKYRELYSAGNYTLRDIPDDLWVKAKHQAVDEGISLRDLILKSLREYLS